MRRAVPVIVAAWGLWACGTPDLFDSTRCLGKCDSANGWHVDKKTAGGNKYCGPGRRDHSECRPRGVAEWTVLVYAANDDRNIRLVEAFENDIEQELMFASGSDDIRVLVQRDYAQFRPVREGKKLKAERAELPTERFGIYGEQRFHPESLTLADHTNRDNPHTQVIEPLESEGDDVDSSDWRRLADFLVYGIRRFPARRYFVIVTGHGDGWNGLAYDYTSGATGRMSLADFRRALDAATTAIRYEVRRDCGVKLYDGEHSGLRDADDYEGIRERYAELDSEGKCDYHKNAHLGGSSSSNRRSERIDLIQFDACRMAAVEVAAELVGAVDYVAASQEVVPNAGHRYSVLPGLWQNHQKSGPETLIKELVPNFVESYVDGPGTANRTFYYGKTVSAIGFSVKPQTVAPIGEALRAFREAIVDRPGGSFTCAEVARLRKAAIAWGQAKTTAQFGRAPETDEGDEEVIFDSDNADGELPPGEQSGRASAASQAAVDMVSLFEVFAGFDRWVELLPASGSNCRQRARDYHDAAAAVRGVRDLEARVAELVSGRSPDDEDLQRAQDELAAARKALVEEFALDSHGVRIPADARDAALELLQIIDRPTVRVGFLKSLGCGAMVREHGQFIELNGYGDDSPVIVEAHRINTETLNRRAAGASIFFGDPFKLVREQPVRDGRKRSPLDVYAELALDRGANEKDALAWTKVFEQCTDEAKTCVAESSDEACAFWRR